MYNTCLTLLYSVFFVTSGKDVPISYLGASYKLVKFCPFSVEVCPCRRIRGSADVARILDRSFCFHSSLLTGVTVCSWRYFIEQICILNISSMHLSIGFFPFIFQPSAPTDFGWIFTWNQELIPIDVCPPKIDGLSFDPWVIQQRNEGPRKGLTSRKGYVEGFGWFPFTFTVKCLEIRVN